MIGKTRSPHFGGRLRFYPDNALLLEKFIESVTHVPEHQIDGKGLMVPHAGYQYSGKTLYRTLKALKNIPENIIIIGPNHTGIGEDVTIMTEGFWQVMGQTIPIHKELAQNILLASSSLYQDSLSHEKEHAVEVILPLLLTLKHDIHLVPIIMKNYHPSIVEDIAEAILKAIQLDHSPVLIIASSDMSHYVSKEEAKQKDEIAFQSIRRLDTKQLLTVVRQERISMCGSGPVAVAMHVSLSLGATRATLIDYTDSSEETKDTSEVVSYAGFVFH